MKQILVHTCCAPCASASVERLIEDGWQPVLYFYMPNIFPFEEFEKRLSYVQKLADYYNIQLIVGDYNHSNWLGAIKGTESAPEGGARCELCYKTLLQATSIKAQELGILHFCTTLTISPHKNSKKIEEIGSQYQGYTHYDFKKQDGYKRSIELSKELDLYRQCYCACEFSMKKI
jgi:predicted adenine nucleotide alpha hydrolase (AANH) superfamily ATPase